MKVEQGLDRQRLLQGYHLHTAANQKISKCSCRHQVELSIKEACKVLAAPGADDCSPELERSRESRGRLTEGTTSIPPPPLLCSVGLPTTYQYI